MTTILLTIGLVAVVMLIMAVGVIFKGRCLRGSCGGPETLGVKGDSISCALCLYRQKRTQQDDPTTAGTTTTYNGGDGPRAPIDSPAMAPAGQTDED